MVLKVFGCLIYAFTILQGCHKLDPQATKIVFLGYNVGTKGFVVMNI